VDTARLKLQIFILSALYASLAGSLYAHALNFIAPSSFDIMFSIKLVTMVVVGGMASIWGRFWARRRSRFCRNSWPSSRIRGGDLRRHPHGGDDLSAPGPAAGIH